MPLGHPDAMRTKNLSPWFPWVILVARVDRLYRLAAAQIKEPTPSPTIYADGPPMANVRDAMLVADDLRGRPLQVYIYGLNAEERIAVCDFLGVIAVWVLDDERYPVEDLPQRPTLPALWRCVLGMAMPKFEQAFRPLRFDGVVWRHI